jgi:hypothetical protein
MGQPFHLLGHPIPGERFKGPDNAGMEHAPPLLEHTAIGDLVRQGVLEGIFMLREEVCFV